MDIKWRCEEWSQGAGFQIVFGIFVEGLKVLLGHSDDRIGAKGRKEQFVDSCRYCRFELLRGEGKERTLAARLRSKSRTLQTRLHNLNPTTRDGANLLSTFTYSHASDNITSKSPYHAFPSVLLKHSQPSIRHSQNDPRALVFLLQI